MLNLIRAVILRIYWAILIFLFYFLRIFPIKKNKIVVCSYFGKGFGDNGKYIVLKLLKENNRIDIVWLSKKINDDFPSRVRVVKYNSLRGIYELVTAKIWIDNCRKPIFVRKRKNQFYLQCWHGDIPLKMVEKDAISNLYRSYIKMAKRDSKMVDLFVAGNEFIKKLYLSSFWYNGNVLECSYPRRDILYEKSLEKKMMIKKSLKILNNVKICLYAPTFRDSEMCVDVYLLDWQRVINALELKFGGEWVVLFKLHPNISFLSKKLSFNNKIIDVTNYPDMQELLFVSDVCVSDYSSSLFEFAVTRKPGFIFARDYENYKSQRNFYFDISDTPFYLSKNEDEFINSIINFNEDKYQNLCETFYNKNIKLYDNGGGSDIIAKCILKEIYD